MTRTLSLLAAVTGLAVAGGDDKKPPLAPHNDIDFVTMAASGNMLEVKLGQLAATRAKTEGVKQFARRMVEDHTKANEQLAKAAEKAGMALPAKLAAEHQKCLDKFASDDVDFDRLYLTENIKGHEMAVAAFKRASAVSKDPGIKDYAVKTLPILESHLQAAKKLKGTDK